jgi:hypothetical protein
MAAVVPPPSPSALLLGAGLPPVIPPRRPTDSAARAGAIFSLSSFFAQLSLFLLGLSSVRPPAPLPSPVTSSEFAALESALTNGGDTIEVDQVYDDPVDDGNDGEAIYASLDLVYGDAPPPPRPPQPLPVQASSTAAPQPPALPSRPASLVRLDFKKLCFHLILLSSPFVECHPGQTRQRGVLTVSEQTYLTC